jgi:tetratricopeptide (TPR) repeat protein
MNRQPPPRRGTRPPPGIFIHGRPHQLAEAGERANQEQQRANYQAAADIYDLILARFPDCAEACYNRGIALHRLKRYAEALASFDQAIALQPNYAQTHNNRGVTL